MSTDLRAVSIADLKEERPNRIRAGQWGKWKLKRETFELIYDGWKYPLDLERCNTPAQVLDWIFQLHHKTWMTPRAMHDLLQAFDDLFYPQATLCSGGRSAAIDAREHLVRLFQQMDNWSAATRTTGRRTANGQRFARREA